MQQIAILGYRRDQREKVENHIRACLGYSSPYTLRQYSLDEPKNNPAPFGLVAVFAIVDDTRALETVQKLADWGGDLPLVIIRTEPEFTLEGKLSVKRYLLYPPGESDVREALRSIGLEAEHSAKNTGSLPSRKKRRRTSETQIAIFGSRREHREEVERHILACLGESDAIVLRQYGMDEPRCNPALPNLAAAFVIMSNAKQLSDLRIVAGWGKELPVVIVSDHPQYALEGIRLQVRHYILLPLVEKDVREALLRVGIGGEAT